MINVFAKKSNLKNTNDYSINMNMFFSLDLDNFIAVAQDTKIQDPKNPKYNKAVEFMQNRLRENKCDFGIIEYGDGITEKDRIILIKDMEKLWKEQNLLTLGIWISKNNFARLSIKDITFFQFMNTSIHVFIN